MEILGKLEQKIQALFVNLPELPNSTRQLIAKNVWWVATIVAVLTTIVVFWQVIYILALLVPTNFLASSYFPSANLASWLIVLAVVSLLFAVFEATLLYMSIQPLKALHKKGWVLLFALWLVNGLSILVSAILSFNLVNLVWGILSGAVWLAASGYFLFEIHGQFAHVEKSKGINQEESQTANETKKP